jgi:hypothetical protein
MNSAEKIAISFDLAPGIKFSNLILALMGIFARKQLEKISLTFCL